MSRGTDTFGTCRIMINLLARDTPHAPTRRQIDAAGMHASPLFPGRTGGRGNSNCESERRRFPPLESQANDKLPPTFAAVCRQEPDGASGRPNVRDWLLKR